MTCTHCDSGETILHLRNELDNQNHVLKRLQLDLETMNQKYVAEIERVAAVQHEKDMVEHELEDLSRRLFEQANEMVSNEKRARWQLEKELRDTQEHLLDEQTQLSELRLRLTEDATDYNESTKKLLGNSRVQSDLSALHGLKRASANPNPFPLQKNMNQERALSMPPPAPPSPPIKQNISIDEFQLNAFKEFQAASTTVPFKKLTSTTFIKYCLHEDVEPCLRFGPNSKLSTRKMIDQLSRQPCYIEHMVDGQECSLLPTNTSKLWARFNNNNNNNKDVGCAACGRSNEHVMNYYRFKLDENDPWMPIDSYCRDRLVAVCEFFVFVRNIQMGLYADRALEDLYTENIRLRLQMFYSR
jgi:hypothetical protein